MLVKKIVFQILMMLLDLVMDKVCLSKQNFMINIYKSIKCYHVNIWGLLGLKMEKNDKIKMAVRLSRSSSIVCPELYLNNDSK